MAFIKYISTYIPENGISNEDITKKFSDWDSDKILSKIGIRNRNVTSENEFTSDITIKALQNIMLVGFGIGYSWGAVCLKKKII